MRSVYYLVHLENGRRLRWYHTLAGARIAQRSRNRRLGFTHRVERVWLDNCEYERCSNSHGEIVDATWSIVEDSIDIMDLSE